MIFTRTYRVEVSVTEPNKNNTSLGHTYTLVVDRQSSLQLICAHLQEFQTLVEINIGIVVLVQQGKTVVSAID